jgi:hypothetical protein
VPVTPEPEIIAARLRDPGTHFLLLLECCPWAARRDLLAGELDPFRARRAVVVQVKPRIGAEDLDPRADEKPDEEHIDPVSRAYPDWEVTHAGNLSHSA